MSVLGPTQRTSAAATILSPLVSMWTLFVGVGFMMVGNGLQATLLGVRSSREGFDTVVIGAIQASYYVGFLAGSVFTIRALGRVGHIRVFAALASLASTAALIHGVFVNEPTWIAMRLITGVCMAGLYVVVESWLNDQTPAESRGRALSLYMVVTMLGITGGQFLLNVADPGGIELFVASSALVSLSLVPMTLSATTAPSVFTVTRLPLRTLLRIVPSGVITMFFVGAAAGSLFAMGPVYANDIGMTTAQISLFVSASLIGATIFQMPIGSVSDRLPRRGVIAVVSIVATAASVGGFFTDTGFSGVLAMFAIGATSFPLYSLAIAYTNDWITDDQRVGAAALLVMVNGVGAILGPLAAALLMRGFGTSAFWWSLVAAHAIIALYILYRIAARDPVPIERQSSHLPLFARGSAAMTFATRIRRIGKKEKEEAR